MAEGNGSTSLNSQLQTPLHSAASKGDASATKFLLEEACPVNAQDEQGRTAAIWASLQGNVAALQVLLDFDADLTLTDVRGWNALRWATAARHVPVIKLLQAELRKQVEQSTTAGASFNHIQRLDSASQLPDNARPVEWAAGLNDERIFDKVLFAYGSVSSYWDYMWPRGQLDRPVVNFWRLGDKPESGFGIRIFDPSPWKDHSDNATLTNKAKGLDNASDSPNNDRTELKTRKGQWRSALLATAIRDEKLSIVHLLLKTGALPNDRVQSYYGRTPLHVAALRRDPSYVRELARFGAAVDRKDVYGQTPLIQAVVNGFPETVLALLEAGSDADAIRQTSSKLYASRGAKNYRADREQGSHLTVLMLACGYARKTKGQHEDQAQILDMLITHGADLSVRDSQGRTSLHYAAMCGQLGLATSALSAGIDVNTTDQHGVTALHIAVSRSGIDMTKFLVANGADMAIRDKFGKYAIHWLDRRDFHDDAPDTVMGIYQIVCPANDMKVLQVEFDAKEARGRFSGKPLDFHTLLSIAIEREHWSLAKLLIGYDAPLPTQNIGSRPFSWILYTAISCGQTEIVHFLAAKGHKASGGLFGLINNMNVEFTVLDVEEMMQELVAQGECDDFDTLPSEAARVSNDRALPGIIHRYGVDLFWTKTPPSCDAAATAVMHGNLGFLQGLIDVRSTSVPTDHWLQSYPTAEIATDQAPTPHNVCATLAAAGKLDMKLDYHLPTMLLAAIEHRSQEIAVELIKHGASLRIADSSGWLPLHLAVWYNDKEILKCILSQDAIDVDARVHRWYAMIMPRPSGMSANSKWHGTSLHIACIFGHVDMVKCLLEHGASANACATPEPEGDEYVTQSFAKPLAITLTVGEAYELSPELSTQRLEIARLLLAYGADPSDADEVKWSKVWRKFEGFEDVWDRLRVADAPQAA